MKNFKGRILSIFLILFMLVKPTFTQAEKSEKIFHETDDKVEQLFDQRTQILLQGRYDEVENIDNQVEYVNYYKRSRLGEIGQKIKDFLNPSTDYYGTYAIKESKSMIFSGRDMIIIWNYKPEKIILMFFFLYTNFLLQRALIQQKAQKIRRQNAENSIKYKYNIVIFILRIGLELSH